MMTDPNMFELVKLIKAAKGDPSAMTDAIWEAGYRQPERTAEQAAQITIDTFFYCHGWGIPAKFWPESYDSVLQNELIKAVTGEDGELDSADVTAIARSVIAAGFSKEVISG
ncbi:TPA: hypothetical protein ACPUNM_000659 [Klebsiella pneumoniae]